MDTNVQNNGIVRRVDDLGRIVIPKEIRKTLRIKEGDPIEISRDGENIYLKKYSPIDSLMNIAKSVAEGIGNSTDKVCVITDTDKILFTSDKTLDDSGSILNGFCSRLMSERKVFINDGVNSSVPEIYIGEKTELYVARMLFPLVKDGDCYGLIVLTSKSGAISDKEQALLKLGANIFLNTM